MTEPEPITEDELVVAWDLWRLRLNHKAGGVKPEYLPAAHKLHGRGWVSRRIQNDDVIFEFTDQGLAALEMGSLRRDQPADQN